MKISHFGHLSWSVLGQESLQGNGLNHRGKINCVGRELVNARRNRKELGRKLCVCVCVRARERVCACLCSYVRTLGMGSALGVEL